MQVLIPGYRYLVSQVENTSVGIEIQFIEKARRFDVTGETPTPEALQELVTVNDGTTHEELMAVLIHRLRFLQDKLASEENGHAIRHMEEALMWLEKRTKDRRQRGVEGTHKA